MANEDEIERLKRIPAWSSAVPVEELELALSELAVANALIAELEADVVWCVENPYQILDTSGMWDDVPGNAPNTVLLLKVREARNG